MSNVVPVQIKTKKWIPRKYFKKFCRQYHLSYREGTNGQHIYTGKLDKKKYRSLKKICDRHGIHLVIDNDYGKRSADYRKVFFATFPSDEYGRYYCAYCGKRLTADEVTVDHLYPIKKGEQSLKIQKRLKRKGFSGINDPQNLVPACRSCNSKKGSKTGIWLIRGKVGRHIKFWKVKRSVEIIFFTLLLIEIISFLYDNCTFIANLH